MLSLKYRLTVDLSSVNKALPKNRISTLAKKHPKINVCMLVSKAKSVKLTRDDLLVMTEEIWQQKCS